MSLTVYQQDKTPAFYALLLFGYMSIIPIFRLIGLLPDIAYSEHISWFGNLLLLQAVINTRKIRPSLNQNLIFIFLFLTLYMAFIGYNGQNANMVYYWSEFSSYFRFALMMLLGYKWAEFNSIKKAMMILLTIGIVVNIFSLFTATTFLREMVEEKTLTYKLQYILIPSAFYLFLYDKLDKQERIIVVTAFAIYALEQILFQKRLPTLRVLLTLVLFFYSNSLFTTVKARSGLLFKRLITFVVGFVVGATLLSLIGFNIGTYFSALMARFFTESTITQTVEEDDRWKIGDIFYEDLERTGETYTGRGFGGVVFDPMFQMADEQGREFRLVSEMGVPTMILKGGVGLVVYFGVLGVILLWRFKKAKQFRYSFAAWCTAFIWFVFLYAEGFIGNIYSINEIFVAYTIGLVLARSAVLKAYAEHYENNPS